MQLTTEGVDNVLQHHVSSDGEGEIIPLTRFGEVRSFAGIWKRTLETNKQRCPTHLPAWSEATLSSVSPFMPCCVLLGIGPETLEFILPLKFRSYRLFGRNAIAVEAATELSPFFSSDTERWLPLFIQWLDDAHANWSQIEFSMIQQGDSTAAALEQTALKMGLHVTKEVTHFSPYLEIAGEYTAYLHQRRNKIYGGLRNRRERLAALGCLKESRMCSPEQMPTAISAMFEIEQESWKYDRRSDMTSREFQHLFYYHLCGALALDGQLSLNLLRLNDEPISYELDILLDGAVYSLKHSYKQRFSKFSPGTILRLYSLGEYFEKGMRSVNFWGSADRFKHMWTDQDIPHYRLTLFRKSVFGIAASARSTLQRQFNKNRVWRGLNNFFVGPVGRHKMKNPPPSVISAWLKSLLSRQRQPSRAAALSPKYQTPPPQITLISLDGAGALPGALAAALARWPQDKEDLTPSRLAVCDGIVVAGIVARSEPEGVVVMGCYIDPAFRSLRLISAICHSFLSTHQNEILYFDEDNKIPDFLSFDLLTQRLPFRLTTRRWKRISK